VICLLSRLLMLAKLRRNDYAERPRSHASGTNPYTPSDPTTIAQLRDHVRDRNSSDLAEVRRAERDSLRRRIIDDFMAAEATAEAAAVAAAEEAAAEEAARLAQQGEEVRAAEEEARLTAPAAMRQQLLFLWPTLMAMLAFVVVSVRHWWLWLPSVSEKNEAELLALRDALREAMVEAQTAKSAALAAKQDFEAASAGGAVQMLPPRSRPLNGGSYRRREPKPMQSPGVAVWRSPRGRRGIGIASQRPAPRLPSSQRLQIKGLSD